MESSEIIIRPDEAWIAPDNPKLQYSGRIDFTDKDQPVFLFPCSCVAVRFTGRICKIMIENKNSYWTNYLGFIIDEKQGKIRLPNKGKACLTLTEDLDDGEHTLMLFKRMDACHSFRFLGFVFSYDTKISSAVPRPERRIEVYGDSVSAGEVSEAVDYTGKPDPEHDGEYSNSWYSFAWMTARKLKAEIHDIAQGGIALLDHTGWFGAPDFIGMESVYNKLQYNPELGESKLWNFALYRPHIVIVAIGQNDNHPEDYMAENYDSDKSNYWRKQYYHFIKNLRKVYPHAVIILMTTIMCHDLSWDRSIEQVKGELSDEKVFHFLFSRNGMGTDGHIRISEAERMSEELSEFIRSLGDDIWLS